MKLFGKGKSKKAAENASDYVMADEENLPVAVAIPDAAPLELGNPSEKQSVYQANVTKDPIVAPVSSAPVRSNVTNPKMPVSRKPLLMSMCPHCNNASKTRTRTSPSIITWLSVGALALAFWPICWIPLFMDQARDTKHYCIHCNAFIGKVSAYQDCCSTSRG